MPKTGETGAQREARTTAKAVGAMMDIAHSAGKFQSATETFQKTRAKWQQIRGDNSGVVSYVKKPR